MMIRSTIALALTVLLLPGAGAAMPWAGTGDAGLQPVAATRIVHSLPGLERTKERLSVLQRARRIALPIGPWTGDGRNTIERMGDLRRSVYRVEGLTEGAAPLAAALEKALRLAGYELIYSCESRECGGFDFRFSLDVAPPPAMHVDLGDYHYLLASRTGEKGPVHVMALVSRSGSTGFIQIDEVLPTSAGEGDGAVVLSTKSEATAPIADALAEGTDGQGANGATDLGELLLSRGAAVLEGLRFARGSARLEGEAARRSLSALAAFLEANPDHRVMLVGHTDATGSLAGNLALSRKRAESVRRKLIEDYGISPAVVSAEGAGFLAPRAPNTSEKGRSLNRRVEAILLN